MGKTVTWPVGHEYGAIFDPGDDSGRYGVTWVRDQLLVDAELKDGDRLWDVGAGPELLAVETARRLGTAGRLVALDLSQLPRTRITTLPPASRHAPPAR